ncbi:DUF2651 family protein [Terrilactibacillus tamarindi]|uniref:DUF2651 family protein n=1 Tax=Terrilactibacillus tamarindi TaxID=2599694 RepID=UPI0012BC35C1|nr:DUF2651 family protein [Terrilactibacillus tamarindi]
MSDFLNQFTFVFLLFPFLSLVIGIVSYLYFRKFFIAPMVIVFLSFILSLTIYDMSFLILATLYTLLSIAAALLTKFGLYCARD